MKTVKNWIKRWSKVPLKKNIKCSNMKYHKPIQIYQISSTYLPSSKAWYRLSIFINGFINWSYDHPVDRKKTLKDHEKSLLIPKYYFFLQIAYLLSNLHDNSNSRRWSVGIAKNIIFQQALTMLYPILQSQQPTPLMVV